MSLIIEIIERAITAQYPRASQFAPSEVGPYVRAVLGLRVGGIVVVEFATGGRFQVAANALRNGFVPRIDKEHGADHQPDRNDDDDRTHRPAGDRTNTARPSPEQGHRHECEDDEALNATKTIDEIQRQQRSAPLRGSDPPTHRAIVDEDHHGQAQEQRQANVADEHGERAIVGRITFGEDHAEQRAGHSAPSAEEQHDPQFARAEARGSGEDGTEDEHREENAAEIGTPGHVLGPKQTDHMQEEE